MADNLPGRHFADLCVHVLRPLMLQQDMQIHKYECTGSKHAHMFNAEYSSDAQT